MIFLITNSSIFAKKDTALKYNHCDSYLPGENHISIALIFFENLHRLIYHFHLFPDKVRPAVMKSINSIILCFLHDLGHSLYECPSCNNFTFVWHTCKSRFCNSCGMKYAKNRSHNILQKVFDCSHRHCVFTIPEELRDYFREDRSLLDVLFLSVNQTLSFVIHKAGNINDSLIPCAVLVLHTFGRPLNWNPHIHVLLAEGGLRKCGSFKKLSYINYASLRRSFMKQLLDNLSSHIDTIEFKQLKRSLYKDYPDGFYVFSPPSKYKDVKDCADYVIRYVGRPVMAQSRILDYNYDMDHVLWYYEDHESGERVDVYDSCVSFMKKLILHIPDKNYRMIRYIGGYATKKQKLANMIRKMVHSSQSWILKKANDYRQYRMDTTGIDPLLCSCGCEMEFVDCYFPPGIQEKVNEKWKFPRFKYDPLQVY